MPKPGNPFSKNILPSTQTEELSSTVARTEPSKGPALERPASISPKMAPREEAITAPPETKPGRSAHGMYDYRTKKLLAGKKAVSIVIDDDLRMELRPRMMFRKLTWDTLIGGLLRQWLEENPDLRP